MKSPFRSFKILLIVFLGAAAGCYAPARDSEPAATGAANPNAQSPTADATAGSPAKEAAETISPSPQAASGRTGASVPADAHSDDSNAEREKPPKIVAPIRKVDFGRQPVDATVVRSVPLRNTGSGDLTLDSVESSCGCTTVDFPKMIRPGKTGTIKVKIETGKVPGSHIKTVTIRSNDPDEPAVQIQFMLIVKG